MNIESLVQLVGFPAICVIAIGKYLPKIFDRFFSLIEDTIGKMREEDKITMDMLRQELNFNREVNTELLKTNREISETNRLLATEIKDDVGNIEKKLDEFMYRATETLKNRVE